jgi:hypothetical protein
MWLVLGTPTSVEISYLILGKWGKVLVVHMTSTLSRCVGRRVVSMGFSVELNDSIEKLNESSMVFSLLCWPGGTFYANDTRVLQDRMTAICAFVIKHVLPLHDPLGQEKFQNPKS